VVHFAGKTKRLEESGLANQFLPPFRLTGYFQTVPLPNHVNGNKKQNEFINVLNEQGIG